MRAELALLYDLQQVDSELARLREVLAGLETGDALQAEIAAAEAQMASLLERHHGTEKESLDHDLELKTLEEKRTRFQRQLYGGTVHNPRQLADLQGEVEMLSREIGKLEDRILELMDALEQERSEIGAGEAHLAELRGRLQVVRDKHQSTGTRLRGELAALDERRRELAGRVPGPLLKRYEQIRARQANLGVVKVTATTCPGCRIALPSETLKALEADSGTQTCENCGRILFWEPPAA